MKLDGTHVIAVAIGMEQPNLEIHGIASDPADACIITAESFQTLPLVQDTLVQAMCNGACAVCVRSVRAHGACAGVCAQGACKGVCAVCVRRGVRAQCECAVCAQCACAVCVRSVRVQGCVRSVCVRSVRAQGRPWGLV